MSVKKTSRDFYDIEHSGDMQPIKDAIHQLNGKITYEDHHYDSEHWEVIVEHPAEIKDFWSQVDKLVDENYN